MDLVFAQPLLIWIYLKDVACCKPKSQQRDVVYTGHKHYSYGQFSVELIACLSKTAIFLTVHVVVIRQWVAGIL
jgi:hypothetical protein